MRNLAIALIALAATPGLGTYASAAPDQCSIRDSALCLANTHCHWDGEKRGCYPGPLQAEDVCAAHGDKTICDTDVSLGCKWSAEKKKCESQAN
jgi:hypothetical protein